jgi:hypothetical protein
MSDLKKAAQQALEVLESGLLVSHHAQVLINLRAALEQSEQTNPWRDAVDHELSTLHMVASDDPRESIRRLIDWHCAVQIDPLVSSAAQELIERGRREALEQPEQPEQQPMWRLSCGCPSQHGGILAEWPETTREGDPAVAYGTVCERHWHEYEARCPNCANLELQNTELDRKLAELERHGLEPAALMNTWVSETEAVTEPLYKSPRRLTDGEIGEVWFAARIPGLTETAARVLIRAAEARSGAR